jgi:serine protein kinase
MSLVGQIASLQNYATYKELAWEGSFEDYLDLVRKRPQVTRNAYQPRPRAAPAALREGPRRHRHVPAQGREEPGLDRAHRRHQLPQDREYGSDSDPRAFNFDGEFNVANRGIIEFIEVLKLDVAFLYDLLGAPGAQDQAEEVRADDIDEVILGHTNEPEYKKLQNNELMEAFRDRTVKIDVPYNTRLDDEIKIYEKDFNQERSRQAHRAAHARGGGDVGGADAPRGAEEGQPDAAAEAEALQRQERCPASPRTTSRSCARGAARGHGRHLAALHPGQDQQRAGLARPPRRSAINPFMVMNELESGCAPLADQRTRTAQALPRPARVVKEEYEDIVKNEVQRAISADEEAIRGCAPTTSTTSRPTRRRRRSRTSTPAATRSPTSA